jgi:murein L,D-transpeptidase YafK
MARTTLTATTSAIPDSDRARAAAARVRPALEHDLARLSLYFGAPVYLRIFKQERALELWMRGDEPHYRLFRTYPIRACSGLPGPKQKIGDKQAPEGFYCVAPKQFNPHSKFHLGFNLGYPNVYDRTHGRTGNALMVHGDCVSTGCYAMGDAAIEEIYTLAAAALRDGQLEFGVHIFPFRLTEPVFAETVSSPWHDFWRELKPAYDLFEHEHAPPEIRVQNGRYVVASGLPTQLGD